MVRRVFIIIHTDANARINTVFFRTSAAVNDKNIRTEFGNRMFHNGAPKVSESYAIYRYADEDFEKVY